VDSSGLAIVQEIAQQHGASITLEDADRAVVRQHRHASLCQHGLKRWFPLS
jgi:signal transduction histidine kinase